MKPVELEVMKTLIPVAVACISTGTDFDAACAKLRTEINRMTSDPAPEQSGKRPECTP